MVSNCSEQLQVGLTPRNEEGTVFGLTIILSPGPALFDGGGYEFMTAVVPTPGSGGESLDYYTIESVTIENQDGTCVIDEVRVMMPAPPCYG